MDMHDNILLTEAIERYISGEMNPDERLEFENLRKSNDEIDQMVVSHTLFLQKMNRYGEWEKFQSSLNTIHVDLSQQGRIDSPSLKGKAKLVYLFNRYKRVASIAASIAGLTALVVSATLWTVTPKTQNAQLDLLNRNIHSLANKSRLQDQEIRNLKNQGQGNETKDASITYRTSGTGFIMDSRGLLVTSSHVIQNAENIAVQNLEGDQFVANIVYNDPISDVAILKINDKNFKPLPPIPYSFSKKMTDLAEPVFTLGYPKDDIVYNEGYLSSKTGYNGDTLSSQIAIPANRGNSGSPIISNNGEVIGILNSRQKDLEGFAFCIQSRGIYKALNKLKEQEKSDTAYQNLKLNMKSSLIGLNRKQQTKKIEGYVFMVNVN